MASLSYHMAFMLMCILLMNIFHHLFRLRNVDVDVIWEQNSIKNR